SEHERPEAERLEDELVDALHEAFDDPAFEDLPLDAQVEAVVQRLKPAPTPPPALRATSPVVTGEEPVRATRSFPAQAGEVASRPQAGTTEGAQPPPDPPTPYLMPWERAPPGARYPGGSGW
ncbi:hypothetical protein, partial [Phenylobacterium sp.]|uniref:hypothetical protein n=1 Tax=Phenylobacterium sp. TaxID=1871053 RepID=UPI0025E611D9